MAVTIDKDWLIFDNYIKNSGSKDVLVESASLSVDIQNKSGDIFNVLKQSSSLLRVNNDGVFIIQSQSSFPDVQNALIYREGNFYVSS